MFKRTISTVIFCLFISSYAYLSYASGNDKYGGKLILSAVSDPKSFNPIIAKETSTTEITGYIFEGLTTTNAYDQKVEPNLAKSWDISEDGLTWTFHLRDDVKWNDGVKFTADDVVFTFNDLIYNPDIPSSERDIFTIEGKEFEIKKIDDYTVQFTLPVKFAPFLRAMGQAILPKHKLKKAVDSGRFNFTWGIDTDPKDIVGTGPFMLYKYKPGERIELKKNPFYWKRSKEGDKLPYLDGVIYLIVQNEDTAFLKFLEGETDSYGLRGSDYPILKPEEKKRNFTIYELGPAFGTNFLVFNQNRGKNPKTGKPYVDPVKLSWFTDINFRKAIAHAIDKKKILEILKNDLGYKQDSAISPASGFFHNPDVKKYDFNMDEAKKILTNAGYRDRNQNGILEDKKGNEIKFNLYTNAGNDERARIAAIIRSDMERLGMKVNFQVLEFNTLVSKLTGSYDWDAIVLGLTGGTEPHFGKNVWMSNGQLHMWYPAQSTPATEWEAKIDELFNKGVKELDENKRKAIYDEFQMIVSEELPFIYTVLGSRIVAVRNKFGNFDPAPFGGVFHNLEEIYIRK